MRQPEGLSATCQCGQTRITARDKPIVWADCYCTSCQAAGALFEAHLDAPVLEADGSTRYVMYRKDRLHIEGMDHLRAHRLTPESTTRRLVATCCQSPMALDFTKGHWLSIFQARCDVDAPPEIRTMAGDKRADVVLADDVPTYKTHSAWFMWRLMKAWAAMGFRTRPLGEVAALEVGDEGSPSA